MIAMVLAGCIILFPIRWALIPLVGLVTFFVFLWLNPAGRYIRLAAFICGIWGSLLCSTTLNIGFRYGDITSIWANIDSIPGYVHALLAGFASLLVVLDFRARVELEVASPEVARLTKNRLTKFRYRLTFFAAALGLVALICVTFVIADVVKTVHSDTRNEESLDAVDISGLWEYRCTVIGGEYAHGGFEHGGIVSISRQKEPYGFRLVLSGERYWQSSKESTNKTTTVRLYPPRIWRVEKGSYTSRYSFQYTYATSLGGSIKEGRTSATILVDNEGQPYRATGTFIYMDANKTNGVIEMRRLEKIEDAEWLPPESA